MTVFTLDTLAQWIVIGLLAGVFIGFFTGWRRGSAFLTGIGLATLVWFGMGLYLRLTI